MTGERARPALNLTIAALTQCGDRPGRPPRGWFIAEFTLAANIAGHCP